MKRFLILFLLYASSLWGQATPFSGTVTGTACTSAIPVSNKGTVTFDVTGSWSGTIQPQKIISTNPATNIQVTPVPGSTAQNTITANGTYTTTVAGMDSIKFCGATVTSTATIKGNSVPQTAKNVGSGAPPILAGAPSPLQGVVALPNLTVVRIHSENLSTGEHLLYTVPSGKKALVSLVAHNTAVAAVATTATASFDSGGTYKILTSAASVGANATSVINYGNFIYAAGEVVGIRTATNNGLNVFGSVFLFDSTASIRTAKLTALTDGNNTVYTVPAGKTAFTFYILGANFAAPGMFAGVNTTTTVAWNVVLSGGAVGTANRIATGSITGGNASSINDPMTLNAGDFVNIAPTTGASVDVAYISVMEI